MGIAGVGGSAVTNFRSGDTTRFNTIVTGMQPDSGGSALLCSTQDASGQGSIASFNGGPVPPKPAANPQQRPPQASSPLERVADGQDAAAEQHEAVGGSGEVNGVARSREQTMMVNQPSISGKVRLACRPFAGDVLCPQQFALSRVPFTVWREARVGMTWSVSQHR